MLLFVYGLKDEQIASKMYLSIVLLFNVSRLKSGTGKMRSKTSGEFSWRVVADVTTRI